MTGKGDWAIIRQRAQGLAGTEEQQERARERVEKHRASKKAWNDKHRGRVAEQRSDGQIILNKAIREAALTILAGRARPNICEVCAEISQDSGPIHFDHDHKTGAFRGWLCVRCNHALGKVQDSPSLLRKLANYLENPPGPTN